MAGEGTYNRDSSDSPVDYFGGDAARLGPTPLQNVIAGFNGDSASVYDHCHRSPASAAILVGVAQPNFAACSGASISAPVDKGNSVINGSLNTNGEASQLKVLSSQLKAVLLSIGGNDVGFPNVLANCVNGPFFQKQHNDLDCFKAIIQSFQSIPAMQKSLAGLLQKIHALAPNAHILQIGYPNLFPARTSSSTCSGINPFRQFMMNYASNILDAAIAQTDSSNSTTFVDIRPAFAANELCSSLPFINDLQLDPLGVTLNCPLEYTVVGEDQVCSQSFHPNTLGYAAEANVIKPLLP